MSFQPEGAASPATSGCTDRPQVRIFGWLASSGFHSLVETFKPLGILKTLRLVEG